MVASSAVLDGIRGCPRVLAVCIARSIAIWRPLCPLLPIRRARFLTEGTRSAIGKRAVCDLYLAELQAACQEKAPPDPDARTRQLSALLCLGG